MSDDIVTRLRDLQERPLKSPVIAGTFRDAADEIERLRAEVARLGSFLHPIGTVINGQAVRVSESKCDCANMNGYMCYPCLEKDYFAISADNFRLLHENKRLREDCDK